MRNLQSTRTWMWLIPAVVHLLVTPGVLADNSRPVAGGADADGFEDKYGLAMDFIDFGGNFKEEVGYSYQHDDFKLSKLLSSFTLRADVDISKNWTAKVDLLVTYDAAYELEGRNDFSPDTLDVYESDFRLKEFYTDIDINPGMNLRVGRQYFSWGESDNSQISDIGNPRDLREIGLQNVDDTRLPVTATKATFYGASWEYNLIAIHEVRPHELGAEGSEHDPFLASRSGRAVILEPQEPSSSLANTEYLTRVYFSQSWGDISFFWGNTFDDFPVLEIESVDFDEQRIVFQPRYEKHKSYGVFGNFIYGSWLFKFDVARKNGRPAGRSVDNIAQQIEAGNSSLVAWQRKDRLQWMGAVEYSGLSETVISLELYNEIIEDYEDTLLDEEKSEELSLYLSKDFMNDRLTVSFWWNHILGENTGLYRMDFNYDYSDDINYTLAISGIESTNQENFFYGYRKTDRITFGIQFNF